MRAIILAAGQSSRLRIITRGSPKCLLRMSGKSLLQRQIDNLDKTGFDDIVVITGYRGGEIVQALPSSIRTMHYSDFATKNNLFTLHFCRELLDQDCLVMFSDLVVSCKVISDAKNINSDFKVMVDTQQNLPGTMRIKHLSGRFTDIGQHISPDQGDGNFIGMLSMSRAGAQMLSDELCSLVDEGGFEQDYYTIALPRLAQNGADCVIGNVQSTDWIEIDTPYDYVKALFKVAFKRGLI